MDEDKIRLKSKFYMLLKTFLSIVTFGIGILYFWLSKKSDNYGSIYYYTEFVFSIILITLSSIQFITCMISFTKNKYNKQFILFDLIQGTIFGIFTSLIVITFFKRIVLIVKLLFGVVIAVKVFCRCIFFIKTIKLLFKSELSVSEMNRLRKKVLFYNVLKQAILIVISLITFFLFNFGLIQ